MSVGRVCRRPACTLLARETARGAAQRMEQEGVGALVVVEGERPVGLLTDRDLVVRIVAEGQRGGDVRAGDVASAPVVTLSEDLSLQAAASEMSHHGARRMPVIGDRGHLVGMLTADDLVQLVASELTALADVASEQSPRERRTVPTGVSELRPSAHYTRPAVTARATESAQEIAHRMSCEGIGSVIVVDESGRPHGRRADPARADNRRGQRTASAGGRDDE